MATVTPQRARGAYYTPEPIVRYIVQRTLEPLLGADGVPPAERVRVLDPACGDGAFLAGAFHYLLERAGQRDSAAGRPVERKPDGIARRRDVALRQLFGVEVDPRAAQAARDRLARLVLESAGQGLCGCDERRVARLARRLAHNVWCGDALLDAESFLEEQGPGKPFGDSRPLAWRRAFPSVFRGIRGGFDAVIGNPPYVNIRLLTQSRGPAVKAYLAQRYQCARRGYDLYVLFLEKAFELLRPGGRCGMIVPNKLGVLDYAARCRALLLEQTSLCEIIDVSALRAFANAAVYPYIVIWEKTEPPAGHRVSLGQAEACEARLQVRSAQSVPQEQFSPQSGFVLGESLDVEARVPTRSLGQCAELRTGTTGFQAHELAGELVERGQSVPGERFEFIVSGNIDRYAISRGPVRYMKRSFARPVLPAGSRVLTDEKRRLFRGPKIVLAGMSRRLEAAWDDGGLSLGVQVYAAVPAADPWYLLGLLNSKLLSYLFQLRFAAKRLGGGFLAINKGQLARLPVRVIDSRATGDSTCRARIRRAARRLVSLRSLSSATAAPSQIAAANREADRLDREIDQLVYRLYRLTDAEIALVEARFADDFAA